VIRTNRCRIAALLGCMTMLTACASSTQSSTGTSTSASGLSSAQLAYLQAQLKKYEAIPTFVPPGPAFNAAAAKGKLIVDIPFSSSIPFLTGIDTAMEQVAKLAGIRWVEYANQGEPSQWIQGIDTAIAEHANLVILGGAPSPYQLQPQLKALIKAESARCGQHFVSERWLGGTLTNYQTIRSRLNRLEEIETLEASPEYALHSKKMISSLNREKRKLLRNLEGIRKMNRLPAAVLIVDPRREHIALSECYKMGIPSVCVIDTDSDPSQVDILIPGNDDAFRSVQVLMTRLVDAIKKGKAKFDAQRGVTAKGGAPSPAPVEAAATPAAAPAAEGQPGTAGA